MVCSGSTVSNYFHRVLNVVYAMAVDINKPIDPNFARVHNRVLQDEAFQPFAGAAGAVDETHVPIPIIVAFDDSIQHRVRHHVTSRNVLLVIGWDDRVIFADTGWSGSVHDQKMLTEAVRGYSFVFPRLPWEKYFLVDSGYSSRYGFLPPYPHIRYHLDDFEGTEAALPHGKEETFDYVHSSLRNIVERAFGVI